MKVGEFCYKYEHADEDGKKKLLEDHIKCNYVEYAVKVSVCEKVAKWSMYNKDGEFVPNTPMQQMLFVLGIIPKYTDLVFDDENKLRDYDQLVKTGAGDAILNSVGGDVIRFNDVMDMVSDDIFDRERNMVDYINNFIIQFGDALNTIMSATSDDLN